MWALRRISRRCSLTFPHISSSSAQSWATYQRAYVATDRTLSGLSVVAVRDCPVLCFEQSLSSAVILSSPESADSSPRFERHLGPPPREVLDDEDLLITNQFASSETLNPLGFSVGRLQIAADGCTGLHPRRIRIEPPMKSLQQRRELSVDQRPVGVLECGAMPTSQSTGQG